MNQVPKDCDMDPEKALALVKIVLVKLLFDAETVSNKVFEKYAQLKVVDEDLEDHVGILHGITLLLFGGRFATTFAFFEAFQQTGVHNLLKSLRVIKEQVISAKGAVQDVSGSTEEDIASRNIDSLVAAVDPEAVQEALLALWLSIFTATALVKLKFANAITLGSSIGDFIEKPATKYLMPTLKEKVDVRYHKWLPFLVQYICRFIGVSIAFRVYRILATLSSAIRGSDLLMKHFVQLCEKKGMQQSLVQGPLDDFVRTSIVGAGVYSQLFGPDAPMLIRLALLPLTITEYVLTSWVGA